MRRLRAIPLLLLPLAAACRDNPAAVGSVRVTSSTARVSYGQSTPLHFEWRPESPLEKLHGAPRVFVHLLDRPGSVARTFDHPLPGTWTPGRALSYEIDLFQSALAPPLPAGTYLLTVGLFDDSWGYRWVLDAGGPDTGSREYRVATITVPPPARGPKFAFAGGWEASQAGSDQQVVATRWLDGAGTIRADGVEGTGTFRLLVRVPESGAPGVLVSEACESSARRRVEPGERWITISRRDAGTSFCEVRLEAAAPTARRSLCLLVLAWRPDVSGTTATP